MINGIGVVGWGVGGIEAEAGMLGQPVYFLTPDVVGFELTGQLREGVTATDLVLTVTEMLRKEKVVGKFVEFFGEGTASLACPTARRSPTWRPSTARRWASSRSTRRPSTTSRAPAAREARSTPSRPTSRRRACSACRAPARSTTPRSSSSTSARCAPSLAGPKRPQDRIELGHVKSQFASLFSKPPAENGFNQPAEQLLTRHHVRPPKAAPANGGEPRRPTHAGARRAAPRRPR